MKNIGTTVTKQLTKQEIAKELLKPYFDGPDLCSVTELGVCLYSGPDGRMCVFAMACNPEDREMLGEEFSTTGLLDMHGLKILQEKYRHIEDRDYWFCLQYAHDDLALRAGRARQARGART